MILRNFLFELLKTSTPDGYQVGIKIDGVDRSNDRDAIAEKLTSLNCLNPDWSPVGRNGIKGQFNYERIEEVIKNGYKG